MGYSSFSKNYKIAQYASYMYGDKVTLEQIKTSITMIIATVDPRTIAKYVEDVQRDYSPVCKPQFNKTDKDCFMPTPNKPHTPNELIAYAYEKKEREGHSE
ncbi:hypothetical protein MUP77_13730 [Candidatus Bathyarchaeota archaeon]|nr:hypothetical protein [Candidatus Bathyarchaeota archaeon]